MSLPKVNGRIVNLQKPFIDFSNSKFAVMVPDYWFGDIADSQSNRCRSPLKIYENDTPLGPYHSTPQSISMAGMGRSVHLRSADVPILYGNKSIFLFSSTDNTDPRTNGRTYWAVLPEEDEPASACPEIENPPAPEGEIAIQMTPPFETSGQNHIAVFHDLDRLAKIADDQDNTSRSPVQLYEDSTLLGPPHSSHRDIADLGQGRYSHWRTQGMVFSTSDNSDPNTNGRTYWAVIPYEQPPWGTSE